MERMSWLEWRKAEVDQRRARGRVIVGSAKVGIGSDAESSCECVSVCLSVCPSP